MAHHNTILTQILRLLPRHDFKRLAFQHDGKSRSDAMSRWSQFVSMAIAQLCGRPSLRDIESTIASQKHLGYHPIVLCRKPTLQNPINAILAINRWLLIE
ncbi:MAG: DUF4372 domain-containing protein [Gammaproteobacteria bacterium]|nr:DUF4372 domain-containing protein [Gammaproteobacteria bacterium]